MNSAFLLIQGILTPGNIVQARLLEGRRASILFRLANPISRGFAVVLQTADGQCMECVTTECTAEDDYHLVELRCIGDADSFGAVGPTDL